MLEVSNCQAHIAASPRSQIVIDGLLQQVRSLGVPWSWMQVPHDLRAGALWSGCRCPHSFGACTHSLGAGAGTHSLGAGATCAAAAACVAKACKYGCVNIKCLVFVKYDVLRSCGKPVGRRSVIRSCTLVTIAGFVYSCRSSLILI